MAQLPPKIPTTIIPNYHNNNNNIYNNNISLGHHPPPPTNTTNWADDFLDFSSSRRGAHRRSASDSLAFLDYQHDYDDVDAHLLLLSMFDTSPSAAVTSVNPLPQTSDQSSSTVVVIAKAEPGGGEVESVNSAYGDDEDDGGDPHAPPMSGGGDVYPFHDPKRVKRILANRQSAQRSRVRKLHYISELERSVTALQEEVSVLSPRVAYLDHQRLILNVDNGALKQRIAALAQDNIFKDAHQDALKKEIERLRQVMYHRHQQNQDQNSENGNHHRNAEQRLSSIPNDDDIDEKIGN